jgi:hypothetical protein
MFRLRFLVPSIVRRVLSKHLVLSLVLQLFRGSRVQGPDLHDTSKTPQFGRNERAYDVARLG